jgi:hypothetical protein
LVVCVDREAATATAAVGKDMCRYEEIKNNSKVVSIPVVMNGVRSSASGKCMRPVF